MTDVQTRTSPELQHEAPATPGTAPTRRVVLVGAGALGATCLLAACGTDSGSTTAAPEPPAGSALPTTGGATGGTDTSSGGATLASVSEVPNGSGIIKGDLVITQPSEGTFKAFSKTCTHQGCDVSAFEGGNIVCKCHNSLFSIEDGSVQGGPAKKPLTETKVKVDGDNIVAA